MRKLSVKVILTPQFRRMFRHLDPQLQAEAREKILLFQMDPEHQSLKAHKLKGRLRGRYSFSVNYKTRVVYSFLSKTAVVLLAIGSHDVYK